MEEFFSHFSAATAWEIPFLDALLGAKCAPERQVEITASSDSEKFARKGQRKAEDRINGHIRFCVDLFARISCYPQKL
jgi:hypothetical protein